MSTTPPGIHQSSKKSIAGWAPDEYKNNRWLRSGCGAIGSAVDCSLKNGDLLVPGSSPGSRMAFFLLDYSRLFTEKCVGNRPDAFYRKFS